ncbi:MAG: tRNA (adenosine(37)-N6)-threonylcarbamoyltransferase complex ATPase subunit type 1 TsaE [Proteobacteria bacterium]|nr:tRNA (adenosine(37)-N6)-threonylcarbamoyltransferase complex ATPase subunit type 1 TsaE [Pseudomonadota bacterium]
MEPIDSQMYKAITQDPAQTMHLAFRLGERLPGGSIMGLYGVLGSGKTCFVRGLARGLGVPEDVPVVSPTYTLMNEYPGRLRLVHADLYRLSGPYALEEIGFWDLVGPDSVAAVEWADLAGEPGFSPDLLVAISVTGETRRQVSLLPSGQAMRDLVEDILSGGPPRL